MTSHAEKDPAFEPEETPTKRESKRPSKRVSGSVSKEEINTARKAFHESLDRVATGSAEAAKLCVALKKKIRSPSVADLALGLIDDKDT